MKKQQFLPIPHYPSKTVTCCAVGARYTEVHDAFKKMDIDVFIIPENSKLSEPVRCHPDLQIGMIKGESIAVGKGETELKQRLEYLGFHVVESEYQLCSTYPLEALLDFAVVGNRIIGNRQILGMHDLLFFSQSIHVNQGYTKCNLALLNDHAFITSDPSIAHACKQLDFDVLQIRPGFIELPGYSTGFIGGCCGLIGPNQLAVCGDLRTHPDYNIIKGFLDKHQIEIIQLCNGALKDIGGIIPLKQMI